MLIAAPKPAAKPAIAARWVRLLPQLILFAAGAVLAFPLTEVRAEESRTLTIPPNDGYGFEECLKAGSACGFVLADAWCKAHGFAGSKGFAPANETIGAADTPAGSFHVTCADRLD